MQCEPCDELNAFRFNLQVDAAPDQQEERIYQGFVLHYFLYFIFVLRLVLCRIF